MRGWNFYVPVFPFHFRDDGVLVDKNGQPVPPLPKSKRKPSSLDMGGPAKMRKKPNPWMITSDFDGRSEDE